MSVVKLESIDASLLCYVLSSENSFVRRTPFQGKKLERNEENKRSRLARANTAASVYTTFHQRCNSCGVSVIFEGMEAVSSHVQIKGQVLAIF